MREEPGARRPESESMSFSELVFLLTIIAGIAFGIFGMAGCTAFCSWSSNDYRLRARELDYKYEQAR